MPHVHSESKYGKNGNLADDLNEMGELSNCSKCLYLESRKGRDVYMWISNVDGGPSAKFLLRNMHTMNELNMIGNCLKGSRPILSMDPKFDEKPHLRLLKELLVNIFKTPNHHPRSQPFIDHVFNFGITVDENIWFRSYQIINGNENKDDLQEIGPRFTLQLIRIFDGSFCGTVLYDNPDYQSPNLIRRQLKMQKAIELKQKQEQKEEREIKEHMLRQVKLEDPIGELFDTDKIDMDIESDEENDEEENKVKKPKKILVAKQLERRILKKNIHKRKKRIKLTKMSIIADKS